MDIKSLREHLAQLHTELAGSGPVDPETRKMLEEIVRDIVRLTESPGAAAASAQGPSTAQRLEGIAVQFEADHPAFAASIRRLVDLLGKVGV
ncbi:MAG: DUF4404 family protein [Steroidobacterales bacterium]